MVFVGKSLNILAKIFQKQHEPVNKLDDEESQSMKELISNNTVDNDGTGIKPDKKQIRRARLLKESQYKLP